MSTEHIVSPSQMDEIPIPGTGNPYYIRITKTQQLDDTCSSDYKLLKANGCRKFLRQYKYLLMLGILLITLALSLSFGLAIILKSSEVSWKRDGDESKGISENALPYEELVRIIESSAYSTLPELEGNRLKREINEDACGQKLARCKTDQRVKRLMGKDLETNNSYLENLMKNLSSTGPEGQLTVLDIIDCLKCKGVDIKSMEKEMEQIDGESPNVVLAEENSPIDTLVKLLDDAKRPTKGETEKEQVSTLNPNLVLEVTEKSGNSVEETVLDSTSIAGEEEAVGVASSTISWNERFMPSTYPLMEASSQKENLKIADNEKQRAGIVEDAGRKEAEHDVSGIASGGFNSKRIQPDGDSSQVSDNQEGQRLIDIGESGRSAANVKIDRRIVSQGGMQVKGNADGSQMMIPTAETIKSSQQLQLTPTMSWMQYPVCFYGPGGSGSTKQSALGPGSQVIYPASASSPTATATATAMAMAPYPMMTMPQQRGTGFHNSANQAVGPPSPNYVQVQANSVQFMPMPMQSFSGQRVGPTGPAGPIPFFPGNQGPSATNAANSPANSPRAPYYCTYIPAPAFQYPAIPGVSEYQRSATANRIEDGQTEGKPIWSLQQPLLPGYPQVCPSGQVRCEDSSGCISKVQWCDGHVDCNDASDETRCSCRDRITKERLCDGYFDCPHGEDELGCFGCSRTSFSCGDWSRRYSSENCVPLTQRCDGVTHCANGKDEMDCSILTPTYIEGKNVFTMSYAEGYLHKNLEGRWYPVCTATASWAMDACKSEIGPEMNGVPDIKIHTVPDKAYQGPYLAEVNGVVKVVQSCQSRIVEVRCPAMPCGSRLFSREESFRSRTPSHSSNTNNHLNETGHLASRSAESEKLEKSSSRIGNSSSVESTTEDSLVGAELRVVGGRASQPKAWPFLVAIYKDGIFHCGGVIVNELWILTAAHCLDEYTEHYFEVQAGVLRQFSFSPMAQSRKAKYTIIHSEYRSKEMQNDIGMIMLDEPLYFNRWVRPICLPEANQPSARREPQPGSTCIAIGWGATRERGPDPGHLREVEVGILPACPHPSDQNEGSICAGYPQGGRDACQGDSGGPLMCRGFFSESHWYVAGIVSHGEGCGRPNEPGAYARVSYYVHWIEQVSNGRGKPSFGKSPLDRCPGFNCEGGLGKCLPIEMRCNRMVDCLDGEDEVNCPRQLNYPLFRQSGGNSQVIVSSSPENSTEASAEHINEEPITPDDTRDENNSQAVSETEPSSGLENEGTISTDIANEEEKGPVTAFTCTILIQSIPIGKRCDRILDCEDGTDESNCTCRDFLLNNLPTAICDGILDCDDMTDEANCGICSGAEFLCRRSGTCIPLASKCDGKYDCELQEDELDCFALTDGRKVHLDVEARPVLSLEGILTRNVSGQWRPTCHHPIMHQNQSTLKLIGENMCKIFGFVGLESANRTAVNDGRLEMASGNGETATWHEPLEIEAGENETGRICPGLYIRCRPVLNSSLGGFLRIARNTGNKSYLFPWMAAIFVDGSYHCSATLLDHEWLLASATSFQGLSLDKNYIVAVLGYTPSFLYANGPHEQISRIDGLKYVDNSVSMLLHLTPSVNLTRYVQPLLLERKIYPATAQDRCLAVGTNDRFETTSISLRPVLNNCQSCSRCFINVSTVEDCKGNERSDWSGTVFCRGQRGWYPAGAFYEKNGPCGFANQQNLTSIDYINPHYMEATEDEIKSVAEPGCNGFRCHIGKCIEDSRVCDGVQDCRDGADEDPDKCERVWQECENHINGCNSCRSSEMRCGDGKLVGKSAFCDGIEDCNDGSDEPVICSCAEYLKLAKPERICDGIRHCFDKSDESPESCPCRDDGFKCTPLSENGKCIPQDFVCDGVADCDGGEDEANCRMLKNTDLNRPQTGEVMHRSFGVWHTECFSSPVETEEQANNLCNSMGYTSGSIYQNPVNISLPLVPIGNHFYIIKLNRWTWLTMQNNDTMIELGKPQDDCHRAFLSCV